MQRKTFHKLMLATAAAATMGWGSAQAQTMNEQTFLNGDNSNYGAMFANKITVDCP